MRKIIVYNGGIQIGNKFFPSSSITFYYEGENVVILSNGKELIKNHFSSFVDSSNTPFTSLQLLIEELKKSHVSDITLSTEEPLRTDFSTNNVFYYGYADIGSSTSSPVWSIKKVEIVNKIAIVKWADGNKIKNKIWDNRTTLNYL